MDITEYTNFEHPASLPFKLRSIGEHINQNSVTRKPGPSWNQIIWVKKGKGVFYVGEETFTLSEGEGIFMRHDAPHAYRAIGGAFHTGWVTFEADDRIINYSLGNRTAFAFKCPDSLEKETSMLLEYAQADETDDLRLSAAGYSYLAELFCAITKNTDETIDKVRNYLIKNYPRPLSLDEIAEDVGMDKYSLCRYFAKNHTCSVMDELKRIRVSHAKQLLRYSSDSVEEIGRKCGFDSPSYFSLRFRELTGRTPLEYRKQYR